MASDDRPFEGLRVIDCASFIAAPAAATILGDFGADVIKIEPPEGDAYREFYRSPGMPGGRNFPFELDGRGRRSIALDLRKPQAMAVLRRLVGSADVFITNLPLPARERLGIDHASLAPPNPRLIYASFTAYGERGPEAGKTGFDSTAYWARSGLMDLVKADHGSVPARSVSGMGDHPSGVALYAAIVTALLRRERTGRGGLVASSLLANGVWANGVMAQAALDGLTLPPRLPREQAPNPLTNLYRCRDGRWLNLTLLNPARQFVPLCEAMECPGVPDDPRFATAEARSANHLALLALLDERFAQRDLAEWRARFDAAGITFGIVGTIYDMPDDEQMRAAGVIVPFADGSGLTVSSPFELAGVDKRAPVAAPGVGEHGDAVLREAGYAQAEIDALRAAGALV